MAVACNKAVGGLGMAHLCLIRRHVPPGFAGMGWSSAQDTLRAELSLRPPFVALQVLVEDRTNDVDTCYHRTRQILFLVSFSILAS